MSFAFVPFYTGDYYRDTRHLSMLQHGAYRLLLDHCWDQRGPLPLDIERCYRITGAVSKEEQDAVRSVVAEFFVQMEDGHYNRRMQQEIERSIAISGKRIEAGRMGGKARAKHLPSKSQASAKQKPQTITTTITTTPNEKVCPTDTLVNAAARPRPASCRSQQIIDLYHEHLPMLPRVEVMTERRKRSLAARWREVLADESIKGKPEPGELALEWFGNFFQYAARSPFLTGKSKEWRATFDWLINPSNFAKVVEGNYHARKGEHA